MERFDLIGAVLGSSLFTWLITFFSTRSKRKAELDLDLQEIYKNHISSIKEINKGLETKVQNLTDKVQKMINLDKEKSQTIKHHENTIDKWERICSRLETERNAEKDTNKLLEQEIKVLKQLKDAN